MGPENQQISSMLRRKSTPSRGLSPSPAQVDVQCHTKQTPTQFVIPPEPPTKDQWIPDYQAEICMVCHATRFSMVSLVFSILW